MPNYTLSNYDWQAEQERLRAKRQIPMAPQPIMPAMPAPPRIEMRPTGIPMVDEAQVKAQESAIRDYTTRINTLYDQFALENDIALGEQKLKQYGQDPNVRRGFEWMQNSSANPSTMRQIDWLQRRAAAGLPLPPSGRAMLSMHEQSQRTAADIQQTLATISEKKGELAKYRALNQMYQQIPMPSSVDIARDAAMEKHRAAQDKAAKKERDAKYTDASKGITLYGLKLKYADKKYRQTMEEYLAQNPKMEGAVIRGANGEFDGVFDPDIIKKDKYAPLREFSMQTQYRFGIPRLKTAQQKAEEAYMNLDSNIAQTDEEAYQAIKAARPNWTDEQIRKAIEDHRM